MNTTQGPGHWPGRYGLEATSWHIHALQRETRLKASLPEQVQTARDGGGSFADLAALVDSMEAAPP